MCVPILETLELLSFANISEYQLRMYIQAHHKAQELQP